LKIDREEVDLLVDKLIQFFDKLDKGVEHIGKHKTIYMTIFTALVSTYMVYEVRPDIINLEIILAFAIGLIPLMAMMSIMIDGVTCKGSIKALFKKLATGTVSYLAIYAVLLVIQNKLF
jgi:hypothetical protein